MRDLLLPFALVIFLATAWDAEAEETCLDECVSISVVAEIPNPSGKPMGFRVTGTFTPGEIPAIPPPEGRGREVEAEGPVLPLLTVLREDDKSTWVGGEPARLAAFVGFLMRYDIVESGEAEE